MNRIVAVITVLRRFRMPLFCVAMLAFMSIACEAGSSSYQGFKLGSVIQWQCPTATPKPTDMPAATSTTTWPSYFEFNTMYSTYASRPFFYPAFQVVAQNVGTLRLNLSYTTYAIIAGVPGVYTYSAGTVYSSLPLGTIVGPGAIYQTYNYAYVGEPGSYLSYPWSWLYTLYNATICTDFAGCKTWSFTGGTSGPYGYNSYPCPGLGCIPGPIVPTTVPSATPYPTPTSYIRANDFFLNDWIVDKTGSGVAVRVAAINPAYTTSTLDVNEQPQSIYLWKVDVKNVSSSPKRTVQVLPYVQTYIADLLPVGFSGNPYTSSPPPGTDKVVLGPSVFALEEIMPGARYESKELGYCQTWIIFEGICISWVGSDPTYTFYVAAYGPPNRQVFRVGFALDLTDRPAPGSTGPGTPTPPASLPGKSVIFWINSLNPFSECRRETVEP